MSVDETARHKLHSAAEQAFGAAEAATLMAMLPPTGWADVATKADFAAQRAVFTAQMEGLETGLRAELRGRISEMRAELRGEIGQLRTELIGEIGQVHTKLHGEIGEVHTKLHGEIGQVHAELRGEIGQLRTEVAAQGHELTAVFEQRLSETTRTLLLAVLGFTITTWAALAGVLFTR